VLVLDDDESVRRSMERLLVAYGYGAMTAGNLDEALTTIGEHRVDALILDVRLGHGPTGIDLLQMIRARREFDNAPILILTGGVLSDAEEALITRHRAYLFYKPEGFDTLVKFLDSLTERDQLH
jgi:DNA-binding response OmpR family regulator